MKKYILRFTILIITMVSFATVYASEPIFIKLVESDINTNSYDASLFNTNTTIGGFPYVEDINGVVLSSGSQSMASSFFLSEKMSSASATTPGFSTYFQFNVIRGNSSQAADGVVFIVAANTNTIGETGGGLGYQGIRDSVGIEFDFYNNATSYSTNVPHIDVSTNGSLENDYGVTTFDSTFNANYASSSVGSTVRNYHVWVDWNATTSTIEIRVNGVTNTRPTNPTYSETNLNLDVLNDTYYAGFTAATGGMNMKATINKWYFANEYLSSGIDVADDSLSFEVDDTPPTSPFIQYDSILDQVVISGGTDTQSGIYQIQYSLNNIDFSEYVNPLTINSSITVYARAIDKAGNISQLTTLDYHALSYLENGVTKTFYYPNGITVQLPNSVESPIGYSFSGFKTSPESDVIITNVAITSDTEIFPVYRPNTYTLTFNQTLGAIQPALVAPYTSSISLPVLEEPGYTFNGWENDLGETVNYETMPLGNQTLTAIFAPNDYVIDFKTPFGVTPSSITSPYTSSVALPVLFEEGYTFNGWLNDQMLVTQSFVMPISGASLTASFTPNDYAIYFNQTLGAIQPALVAPYTSSISLPVLEEPGYTFNGWENDTGETVNYETMPLGNQTLTAIFTPIDYVIIFNSSLTIAPESITSAYLSLVTLPSISLEGHTFVGWEHDTLLITESAIHMPLYGATLDARFSVNAYTITYQTNAEFELEDATYDYQETIEFPEMLREGYTFSGWLRSGTLFKKTRMIAEDITLKALWEINQYSLTLMVDDSVYDQLDLNFNASLDLPIPSKAGHTFVGWQNDEGTFENVFMPASDITLIAIFEPTLLTLKYTVDGVSTEIDVAYGDTYNPPIPSKPGYGFQGWRVDDELITSIVVEAENIELIATFIPLSARQRIITPLGQVVIDLTTNETLSRLQTLSLRPGYRFIGYYTQPFGGGREITEGFMVSDASNMIIYPHYRNTDTVYRENLSMTLALNAIGKTYEESNQNHSIPWMEWLSLLSSSSLLLILYVKSKDQNHG